MEEVDWAKWNREGKSIAKEVRRSWKIKYVEERRIRIAESKYNRDYRRLVKDGLPDYLKGKMKMKDKTVLARLRCGND
ncbi:hypothetical protein KPH14_012993, partial [Odynerus spinipes]